MSSSKQPVRYVTISGEEEGQRLDNYLINCLKSVPKSKVYHIVRKGEVRVNKKRIPPSYRLKQGDQVRIPPLTVTAGKVTSPPAETTTSLLRSRILYEDDEIVILNKPSGMSVHAGSSVRMGVIEAMRYLYPKSKHIELAHRLDAETSGCLILAKKKRVLRELHQLLREGQIKKVYQTLTKGLWPKDRLSVNFALTKKFVDGGKHVVRVDQQHGKAATTHFDIINLYALATLIEARLLTGRTHQIRVHAASIGHPIAGDDRYGDAHFNKKMRELGLRRMFLHAVSVEFTLPQSNRHIKVVAPLDLELKKFLTVLNHEKRPA